MTDALRSLLHACHLLPPDEFAGAIAAHAARLGVRETVLYLADYGQVPLLPLSGTGVPARQELSVEGTLAGRCSAGSRCVQRR